MQQAHFLSCSATMVAACLLAVCDGARSATPEVRLNSSAPIAAIAPATPMNVAADIIDFAGTTVTSDAWKQLGEYSYLNTTMGYVRRHAGNVLATDEHDLSAISARSAALLNALEDAASTAAGIVMRPGTTPSNKQALAQLETALREKENLLSAVVLPAPVVTSINVSTPERRAAIAALDLAQSARADQSFLAPGRHPTMSAGLDTLERAAQSVLLGDDANAPAAAARLSALSTAINGAARVADGIDRRANENLENRSKASNLAMSLRTVGGQLSLAMRSSRQSQ